MFLFVQAVYVGFTLHTHNEANKCKTAFDWTEDLKALGTWRASKLTAPGLTETGFVVKTIPSIYCNEFTELVPIALQKDIKILPELLIVKNQPAPLQSDNFLTAIKDHGCSWIAGVIAGNGDLEAGTDPTFVLNIVKDFQAEMKNQCGDDPKVTHAESSQVWAKATSKPLLDAVAFVSVKIYPWKQSTDINLAGDNVLQQLYQVGSLIGDKRMWITETGWPTAAGADASSIYNNDNAKSWWQQANCSPKAVLANYDRFWFEAFDDGFQVAVPDKSFGLASSARELKFDLTC